MLFRSFGLTGVTLSSYGEKEGNVTTAKDGRFAFDARDNPQRLFVAHPAGWAEEDVSRRGDNLTVRLERWAVLKGVLVNSNGTPAAGVNLGLTTHNDWQRGDPIINIQGQTKTDANGRFEFLDVPPGRIEVQRIVPMGSGGGWTWVMQTWLFAKGGTNDLGAVTFDRPPAPPALEAFKQKLGL